MASFSTLDSFRTVDSSAAALVSEQRPGFVFSTLDSSTAALVSEQRAGFIFSTRDSSRRATRGDACNDADHCTQNCKHPCPEKDG